MLPRDNPSPRIPSRDHSACFTVHVSVYKSFSLALLAVSLMFVSIGNAQTPSFSSVNVAIGRVTGDQGLSSRSIWAITQDKQGFIWIGTNYGLDRFDGRQCVVYHAAPDSTGLSDDCVWCLFSDQDGSLWIGTNSGLNRFDPLTLTFKKYLHEPSDSTSLSDNEVRCIRRDRAGILWVGTKHGFNRFESSTGRWTRFFPTPEDAATPGDNVISTILEDSRGRFWVGTGSYVMLGGGLFVFDRVSGQFSRVMYTPSNPFMSSFGWVSALAEDSSNIVWISTDHFGLNSYNEISRNFEHLSLPENPKWFRMSGSAEKRPTRHSVKTVCEDRTGALWIATYGSGLFRYDKRARSFTVFANDVEESDNLSSVLINTMFLDNAKLL